MVRDGGLDASLEVARRQALAEDWRRAGPAAGMTIVESAGMHRRVVWPALWLGTAAAIVGCTHDDPLPPAEVQGQIESHLGELLRETNASVAESWSALPPPAGLALLERVLGVDTPVARMVQRIAAQIAVAPAPIDVPGVIAYLHDRVFDDANYLGDGIYRVEPALLCATAAAPGGSGGSPPGDAGCAAQLAKLDLRIHTMVSPPETGAMPSDGGLVFAIQLDAHHDEPLTITLRHWLIGPSLTITWLTAELDLDVLQQALEQLAAQAVTGIPRTSLSGQLSVRLRGDPTGASLTLSIDQPLSIDLAGASGEFGARDGFTLSSLASKVFELILVAQDGPDGVLMVNLGETAVELPAGSDGKRRGLDLAGLTADASLTPSLLLDVVQLSLGGRPATLSVDGVPARTIDLNPDDGRKVHVGIERDETIPALDAIHATPRLDLRMTADHGALGDAPPIYDVARVLLDGTVRTTAASDRVEVIAGSFQIDTDPAGHGFAATAGQCVTSSDATAPSAPPFVQWTVGTCP